MHVVVVVQMLILSRNHTEVVFSAEYIKSSTAHPLNILTIQYNTKRYNTIQYNTIQ